MNVSDNIKSKIGSKSILLSGLIIFLILFTTYILITQLSFAEIFGTSLLSLFYFIKWNNKKEFLIKIGLLSFGLIIGIMGIPDRPLQCVVNMYSVLLILYIIKYCIRKNKLIKE